MQTFNDNSVKSNVVVNKIEEELSDRQAGNRVRRDTIDMPSILQVYPDSKDE